MGTIGLLLLIACANVANLVLVRTQSRRSELSVRTALGARWSDIARVVLAENAILGLAGGVVGVAVAYVSLPYLLTLGGDDLPYIMTVKIDLTVLLAAVAISALATFVFAFIPVLRFARPRTRLAGSLQSARGIGEGHEGNRARQMLLVAQVALALVLLVGCGLMIRTFVTLRQVDPGFQDPSSVQTFQLTLPTGTADPRSRPRPHHPHAPRDRRSAREPFPESNRQRSRARTMDSRWMATGGRVRSSSKARSLETRRPVRRRFSSPRRGSSRR